MSPYEVLGISHTATAEEIKTAYRICAKKNHPDHGGSTEEMQKINAAYKQLTDSPNEVHDPMIDPRMQGMYEELRRHGIPPEIIRIFIVMDIFNRRERGGR